MNDYRLQTEINEQTVLEISLHSEKLQIEDKIHKQKNKIKKNVSDYLRFSALFTLLQSLFAFFFQELPDFFAVIVLTILNSAVLARFFYVLNKQERKRDELNARLAENRLIN